MKEIHQNTPETISLKALPHFPKLLVLVALGFVSAVLLFRFFSKLYFKTPYKVMPQQQELAYGGQKSKPEAVSVFESKEIIPTQQNVKEPQMDEGPFSSLSLNGILFGEDGNFALINGEIVPEGDYINGVKLVKIFTDRVELRFKDRSKFLRTR